MERHFFSNVATFLLQCRDIESCCSEVLCQCFYVISQHLFCVATFDLSHHSGCFDSMLRHYLSDVTTLDVSVSSVQALANVTTFKRFSLFLYKQCRSHVVIVRFLLEIKHTYTAEKLKISPYSNPTRDPCDLIR